ncbi:MAG: hypothetical protein Q8S96_01525 [Hydrogenophaga sp.]|nr:hypothetical protein [Hydrogenophaga sp.]MDP3343120.1 hypothetical protein [Hydrogenophaga sp.]MDP3807181.1 hypothetical protein [Hydrogenophaga sp.]
MNKSRMEGVAMQGEWARIREVLVTKAKWRRLCGDGAFKAQ